MEEQTKQCPFCAEKILAAAIKCKHCGSMLSEISGTIAQPPKITTPRAEPTTTTPERPRDKGWLFPSHWGIGARLLGAIFIIWFLYAAVSTIQTFNIGNPTKDGIPSDPTRERIAGSAQSTQNSPPEVGEISGHYVKEGAEVNVQQLSNDKIRIHLQSRVDLSFCQVGVFEPEHAALNGSNAVLYGKDGAKLSLHFEKTMVIVETSGPDQYCGIKAAGSLNGQYKKMNSKPEFAESPTTNSAASSDRASSPVANAPTQEPASSRTTNATTKDQLDKHAAKINSLGLSTKFLKSTLYLQTDLVNRPQQFIPFEYWLAFVFEHPELVKITAIRSGKLEGVLVKLKGMAAQGFLFRLEEDELFLSQVANSSETLRIETRDDAYVAALKVLQLADAGLPK